MGCAARDRNVVFASTLASFFTRAYDQLRTAAISESNINLCGSHCGLSTGQCAAVSQNCEHSPPPSRSCTSSTLLFFLLFSGVILCDPLFPVSRCDVLTTRPLTSQPSPSFPTHLSALDDVSRGPCVSLVVQVHWLPGLHVHGSACLGSPDLFLQLK